MNAIVVPFFAMYFQVIYDIFFALGEFLFGDFESDTTMYSDTSMD